MNKKNKNKNHKRTWKRANNGKTSDSLSDSKNSNNEMSSCLENGDYNCGSLQSSSRRPVEQLGEIPRRRHRRTRNRRNHSTSDKLKSNPAVVTDKDVFRRDQVPIVPPALEETDSKHSSCFAAGTRAESIFEADEQRLLSDGSSVHTSHLDLDVHQYKMAVSTSRCSTTLSERSDSEADPAKADSGHRDTDTPLPDKLPDPQHPLSGQLQGGSKVEKESSAGEGEGGKASEEDCDCYEEEEETDVSQAPEEKQKEEECKIEKMECPAFQKGSGDGSKKQCARVKVKFSDLDSSDGAQGGHTDRDSGTIQDDKDTVRMKPVMCCPPGSCTLQIQPDCDVIKVDTCASCPAKFVVCQSELTISMKRRALKYLDNFYKNINQAEIFRKFEKSPFAVNLPHAHCLKEFIQQQEKEIEKLKVDIINFRALLRKTSSFSRNFVRAAETEQSMIACAGDTVSDEVKCREVKRIMRIVKIIESERRIRNEIEVEAETIRNRLDKIIISSEKVKRRIFDLNTAPFHPCSKDSDQIIAGFWSYAEALIDRRRSLKEANKKLTKMILDWKAELRDLLGLGEKESILNVAMVSLINYLKEGKFSCNADIPTILHQFYPKYLGNSKMVALNIRAAYDEFQNVIDGKYGLPDVDTPTFEFCLTSPTTSFEDGLSSIRLRDLVKMSPWIHKTTRQFLKIVSKA